MAPIHRDDRPAVDDQFVGSAVGHLLVDLSGAEVGVAQSLLDFAQGCTSVEQVCCKAVAQRVGSYWHLDADLLDIAFDDKPEALACQTLAAMVEKERRFVAVGHQLVACLVQVTTQRTGRIPVDLEDPAVFAASITDPKQQ